MNRSTYWYRSRRRPDTALRMLRREGWLVNLKRVLRLYRDEGLLVTFHRVDVPCEVLA
jgi:hypothetical protein